MKVITSHVLESNKYVLIQRGRYGIVFYGENTIWTYHGVPFLYDNCDDALSEISIAWNGKGLFDGNVPIEVINTDAVNHNTKTYASANRIGSKHKCLR